MFRKILILCLLAAVVTPIVLLSLMIDSAPLTQQTRAPDSVDAQRAKALLKQSWEVLKQTNRTELAVKIDDLNAAVAFLGRGASYLSGTFALEQQALNGSLSLKIPNSPFGQYINLQLKLLPSDDSLALQFCKIGQLRIPGSLALMATQTGLNLLTDGQLGSQLLETVEKVSFSDDQLFVTFRSGAEFAKLKNRLLALLKELKGDPDAERQRIDFYLQQLESINATLSEKQVSLARIMVPLFERTRAESQHSSAQAENRATLYALSIYLGGRDFRKLANYLLDPAQRFPRNQRIRVTLAERQDLLKHFLVSAGIKLMSDSQMGFAVGEFKELLDANKGGSGFSFIDLAADRSGLRFAESATGSEQGAKKFQQSIVGITTELEFFPQLTGLEEGLNREHFIDRYGNVDTQRYQEVVQLIDRRLDSFPLYQ